ncbi:hypothetical protein [Selenomonas sp. GACV-9]|uniref:hypothetical protein n=1 Tax=Selenomonas sp. GACV-9 TaxID=3158782 RepID=UPI001160C0DF
MAKSRAFSEKRTAFDRSIDGKRIGNNIPMRFILSLIIFMAAICNLLAKSIKNPYNMIYVIHNQEEKSGGSL